jgi:phenylpropionate dioxygenase-like ring-hydroxylating dioxygenase large terminal subunit
MNAGLASDYWHLVAHRSELAADRDYLRFDWPLGELALCNDAGTVVAFDNLCPHRGTRFFVDDAGNAPIACPYHGWAYRNGRLRVAKPETFPDCDIAGARLATYRTEWCGDFLFIGVTPKADLATQLGGVHAMVAAISRDIVGRHDFNRAQWRCDWRVAVENALEPDHLPLIHPKSLGTLGLTAGVNVFDGVNSVWQTEISNERMARSLRSLSRLFDLTFQHEGYISLFLFPFAFLSSTFGYSYSLQNFFPAQIPRSTNFASRLLLGRARSSKIGDAASSFFDSVANMNRQVFDEDRAISERVSPRFDLDTPRRFLSTGEEKVRHFRDCVLAARGASA